MAGIFRVGGSSSHCGAVTWASHWSENFSHGLIANNKDRHNWPRHHQTTYESETSTTDYTDHGEQLATITFVGFVRPAPLPPLVLTAHRIPPGRLSQPVCIFWTNAKWQQRQLTVAIYCRSPLVAGCHHRRDGVGGGNGCNQTIVISPVPIVQTR